MEILELATMAAKYIANLLANSKKMDAAKESVIGKSLDWVKLHIFKKKPALEEKVEQAKTPVEKEQVIKDDLASLLEYDSFKIELQEWIAEQRSNAVTSNFFNMEIANMEGDIHVGNIASAGHGTTENIAGGIIGTIKGNIHVGNK